MPARRSLSLALAVIALMTCTFVGAPAQHPAPQRPRITGISHVGFFVSDLPAALTFWHDFLGYDEAYTLPKADGTGVRIAFLKINDHQHIELFNEPPTTPHDMLSHICFSVDNVERMRTYLRSKGLDVKPGNGSKTHAGDYAFEIKDPDGHLVEFVQTLPTGMEARAAGKFAPPTRISTQIYHVGFLVGNSQKSIDFYGGILGFKETWRGGANPKELSWINMRVPDGDDYVEFMLYPKLPPPGSWGGKNHLSLAVPDIAKAVAELQQRATAVNYTKPLDIHVGVNGKRQVNMYDPDGTRVEIMEPFTAKGKPTPPSTAPPPPPSN
jgi:catechol 2,3-dioxygenase-like lactoylglutathione lyase family enzyme